MIRKVARVLPSRKNAESIVELKAAALRRNGVPEQNALFASGPESVSGVEAQLSDLRRRRAQYLGVFAGRQGLGGELLAVQQTREWTAADQAPFGYENIESLARPLGVVTLNALETLDESASKLYLRELMRAALSSARGREVRIGVGANDPFEEILVKNFDFNPTGQHGSPVPGLDQELYVRPMGTELR